MEIPKLIVRGVGLLSIFITSFSVSAETIIDTIVGTGIEGSTGDGGSALEAQLKLPSGITYDNQGNLLVVDYHAHVIRKIDKNGVISTIAGNGNEGPTIENVLATETSLTHPMGIVVDSIGNIYFSTTENKVFRIDNNGLLTRFAGDGSSAINVDSGVATTSSIGDVGSIDIDSQGNMWFTSFDQVEFYISYLMKVAPDGSIEKFDVPGLMESSNLFINHQTDELYIAQAYTNSINRINTDFSGIEYIVGGNGTADFGGDGGPATQALLAWPNYAEFDQNGILYIHDSGNNRIRKVENGVITTAIGTGVYGDSGDGGSPLEADIKGGRLTFNSNNELVFSDAGNSKVRWVGELIDTDEDGIGNHKDNDDDNDGILDGDDEFPLAANMVEVIETWAGTGQSGWVDGAKLEAEFNMPINGAFDANNNLYVVDKNNHVIKKISTDGVVSFTTGHPAEVGIPGFDGDGQDAYYAKLNSPSDIAIDSEGNIYIADTGNYRVRKIDTSGIITTVAGNGLTSTEGVATGGNAAETAISEVLAVEVGSDNTLYILCVDDNESGYVLYIDENGLLQSKTNWGFLAPADFEIDEQLNVFIAFANSSEVTKIDVAGQVITFAGTSATWGFAGDGGPANEALLSSPYNITLDNQNRLFIDDMANGRVRMVENGIIESVIGNGEYGYNGDGDYPLRASIKGGAMAFDSQGNAFIFDAGNHVIRRLTSKPDMDLDTIPDDLDTDRDGDGYENDSDVFPDDADEWADNDADGVGNNEDTDDDNDGVIDSDDAFPFDETESVDTDGDGIGNNADTDDDNDGVADSDDAFPLDATESVDTDGDGIGNNADTDDDNDGVADSEDAFPLDETESVDTDGDGIGNNADTDDDNDGVVDTEDAFPLDETESVDTDGDGIGNNADTDDDNDGVADSDDAFPLDETESVDTDGDGIGNNADTDDDNDGVADSDDAFPLDETESVDTDGDGIGNNADTDDDNDGVADSDDAFPLDETESVDTDGDGIGNNADQDDDNDGVLDHDDAFPLNPAESMDTDNDGIGNNADTDDDNDGVADTADAFPLDANESVDSDGDGIGNNADTDDDGDGTVDTEDAFPLNPEEAIDTDADGIGNNEDTDDDNDGVLDSNDAFPLDAFETVDTDGDGIGNNADTDDDNDGVADSDDKYPLDPSKSKDKSGGSTEYLLLLLLAAMLFRQQRVY